MKAIVTGGGTGGHLMPALAIAEALREGGVDVTLVGATRGVERIILPERGFPFHLLDVEPLYRRQWWRNYKWPVLGVSLVRRARALLRRERPDLVVGTGGYASVPILVAARMAGKPLAIQEQNAYPGLATRMMSRHASQIHLGFPEAVAHLDTRKARVFAFGNPVTPPPPGGVDKIDAKRKLDLDPTIPAVLIMGGSQGARTINRAVAAALEDGKLRGMAFLWSTGETSWKEFSHFAARPNTVARPFWDPLAEAYAAADLVVGRAGAMSTAEYCAWGLPSILIPLPSAAADHQTGNAVALTRAGASLHLPETALTPEALALAIAEVFGNDSQLDEMRLAARARGRPHSARKIASQLIEMMS